MIWTTSDHRVLGLHMDATLNANIMHDLIVLKLYENGKIDDAIRARFIEDIYDSEVPIMRHTMLKVIQNFINAN